MCRIVDDLCEASEGRVILVEGKEDERALRGLGVKGTFYHIQSGGGPVRAAEFVAERGCEALVLTDWDKKGDLLAEKVMQQLDALCVKHDGRFRIRLRNACSRYVKDVESLDGLYRRLAVVSEVFRSSTAGVKQPPRSPLSSWKPPLHFVICRNR